MSKQDEDLQNAIQQGLTENTIDGKAYKKVFSALNKETYSLSNGFSDRLMEKIEARKSLRNDYFWFGMGIALFIIAAVVAAILSNLNLAATIPRLPYGYTGLVLFGLAFVLVLQVIDKKYVQRRPAN